MTAYRHLSIVEKRRRVVMVDLLLRIIWVLVTSFLYVHFFPEKQLDQKAWSERWSGNWISGFFESLVDGLTFVSSVAWKSCNFGWELINSLNFLSDKLWLHLLADICWNMLMVPFWGQVFLWMWYGYYGRTFNEKARYGLLQRITPLRKGRY